MLETHACLSIEVNVDCPHCEHLVNLLDDTDTSGRDHNDDGAIMSQACPEGCWSDKHGTFKVDDVTCSSCKGVFNVRELEW